MGSTMTSEPNHTLGETLARVELDGMDDERSPEVGSYRPESPSELRPFRKYVRISPFPFT